MYLCQFCLHGVKCDTVLQCAPALIDFCAANSFFVQLICLRVTVNQYKCAVCH